MSRQHLYSSLSKIPKLIPCWKISGGPEEGQDYNTRISPTFRTIHFQLLSLKSFLKHKPDWNSPFSFPHLNFSHSSRSLYSSNYSTSHELPFMTKFLLTWYLQHNSAIVLFANYFWWHPDATRGILMPVITPGQVFLFQLMWLIVSMPFSGLNYLKI